MYGPEPVPAFEGADATEGVIDDLGELMDEGFVDDHTGIHPTATTYATITVGTSTTGYATEYATPTPTSYHNVDYGDSDVDIFNSHLGSRDLVFYDGSREWSDYSHSLDPTANSLWTTEGQPTPWVSGFKPRYSWDYHSTLTGNDYLAIVPSMVFWSSNGSQTGYYFFEEVFNDFQAHFGYASYVYKLDGFPAPHWPGMIKTVRSVIGSNQRPIERDRYETWFVTTYGQLFYMAPYTYLYAKMSQASGRPTRFANVNPVRSTRDDAVISGDQGPVGVPDDSDEIDMSDVSSEVSALQAAAVAKAVAAQAATDLAAQTQAVNAALASGAITQQQALAAQAATYAAAQATAVAQQQAADATAQSQAVAQAIAAGQSTQQQAVAAQAAADAAAQSTAVAAQSAADAATQAKAVAAAVAAQAATDSTQQASAVAAQAASDAAAQAAAVASAVAQQSAADATALKAALAKAYIGLPQTSLLTGIPIFQNGVSVTVSSTIGFSFNASTPYAMDYSHAWLPAFSNIAGDSSSTGAGSASYASLAAAQAASGVSNVLGFGTTYYAKSNVAVWSTTNTGCIVYSGWLRAGTQTQICGWILNTGTGVVLATTGYGFTSQSPLGSVQPAGGKYTLTTSSTQSEILSQMSSKNLGSTNYPGALGFIYDASVGSYGQVTWISQI